MKRIPVLMILCVVAPSIVVAQESTPTRDALLYGGDGVSVERSDAARERIDDLAEVPDTEDPSWFLSSVVPLTGNIFVLGKHEVSGCEGPLATLEEFKASVEQGGAAWDDLEFEDALVGYNAALAMLPCLDSVVDERSLGRFHFARAVAEYFQRPRDAQKIRDAFSDAHRTRPDLPWNPDYSYEPQRYFYETRDVLLRGGRAQLWSTLPPGSVYINGRPLDDSYVGHELLGGRHLLQIQTEAGVQTFWIRLGPAARIVLGTPEALWTVLIDAPTGPALERSISARLGIGYALAQDYWLSTQGGVARVLADTGVIDFQSGAGFGIFRPSPWVEGGIGYLVHDPNVANVVTRSPSPHWFTPRIGAGLRVHPAIGVQLGLSLGLSGPLAVEGSETGRTLVRTGLELGANVEKPGGRWRPGARLNLAMLFPGRIQVFDGETFVDKPGVFGGPVAAFTLSARLRPNLWWQVEAGGGWIQSPTLLVRTRVQWRRK